MLARMAIIALPRLTMAWKTIVVAMAGIGFFCGYVGSAGQPCGSLGQCLQYVVDSGLAGLAPGSLVPGATWALVCAAVAYVMLLVVHGVRKAFHWQLATGGNGQSARPKGLHPQPSIQGKWQLARPMPLLLAVGVALAWALLSVGPSRLASDLDGLIPRDKVTAPSCPIDSTPVGSRCSWGIDLSKLGGPAASLTDPACPLFWQEPEEDGMCHERSGGDPNPLVGDILLGAGNGLLASLVVGAALLLWPRLRAMSVPSSSGAGDEN